MCVNVGATPEDNGRNHSNEICHDQLSIVRPFSLVALLPKQFVQTESWPSEWPFWHFSTRRCEDNEALNDRLTNLIIGNPVAFLNKSIATDRIYHSTSSSERGWYADFEYEYEYYLLTNIFRRGKQLWDDITHHLLGTAMSCGLSTFLTPRQENTVRENHAD